MNLGYGWNTLGMMAPQSGTAQGSGGGLMMIGYMLIIFALFYFMLIRPQSRREKERRKLIENIKSGDRIVFSGGILGTVTNVKEQVFVVKIAENVKIEIVRGAVARVLEKDEVPTDIEQKA